MKKLILLSMLIMGCESHHDSSVDGDFSRIKTVETIAKSWDGGYVYITIDGMPCIEWWSGHRGGLTCDWSRSNK